MATVTEQKKARKAAQAKGATAAQAKAAVKAAEKDLAAATKAHAQAVAAANKAHDAFTKSSTKDVTKLNVQIEAHKAKLAQIEAALAPATETAPA